MIAVIVGDDQVVDLFDASLLRGGSNAVRVTSIETGPSGVDQDTLTGRRYKQGGLAPSTSMKYTVRSFVAAVRQAVRNVSQSRMGIARRKFMVRILPRYSPGERLIC